MKAALEKAMTDTVENLMLDLVDGAFGRKERTSGAMEAWRTSCPSSAASDATHPDRGLVENASANGRSLRFRATHLRALLKEMRPRAYDELDHVHRKAS